MHTITLESVARDYTQVKSLWPQTWGGGEVLGFILKPYLTSFDYKSQGLK